MILNKITSNIKCDSVLCFKNATYEIKTQSYKGNQYLCDTCFKQYQKLFKEPKKQNEK